VFRCISKPGGHSSQTEKTSVESPSNSVMAAAVLTQPRLLSCSCPAPSPVLT
jgi:hypothetical protein